MVDMPTVPVSNQTEYGAEQIVKLDPIEHIRLRPGMYVGGVDARALHHLIYEVVDHSSLTAAPSQNTWDHLTSLACPVAPAPPAP